MIDETLPTSDDSSETTVTNDTNPASGDNSETTETEATNPGSDGSSETQQSVPASETKRSELKEKFADNQRPEGKDFARFIDATVIAEDDGLTISTDKLTIDKSLSVTGTLKVGEQLSFSKDDRLTAFNALKVYYQAEPNGSVEINATDSQLKVTGDSKITGTLSAQDGHFSRSVTTGCGGGEVDGEEPTALTVKGKAVLEGDLDMSGSASIDGSLQISGSHTDETALLSLQQTGKGDLLHIDGDAHDIVVDQNGNLGIGHATPSNPVDVNGSLAIGSTVQKVESDYSLAVSNNIGIGTSAPKSRLDILCDDEQSALRLRQNDSTVLSVQTGMDNHDAQLTFSGDTQLQGELTVDKKSLLANTEVDGQLNVGEGIEVQKDITGKANLSLKGDSQLGGNLTVASDSHLGGNLTVVGESKLGDKLKVDGESKLGDKLTVAGESQLGDKLTVAGEARFDETLILSADQNLKPGATLHVKETEGHAGLRIDDRNGETTVLVNDTNVRLGSKNPASTLDFYGGTDIYGDTHIQGTLTGQGHAWLNDGLTVDNTLEVSVGNNQAGTEGIVPAGVTAATIIARGADNQALLVCHDDTTLLATQGDKVGILRADPEADLHIGGTLTADGEITAAAGLTVHPQGKPEIDALSVSDTRISLDGERLNDGIQLKGATTIDGSMTVANWMSVDQQQVTLRQLDHRPVLEIHDADPGHLLHLNADSIAINTATPKANLHINGNALIEADLDTDELRVRTHLQADGQADFDQGLRAQGSVLLNQPASSDRYVDAAVDMDVDLHLWQSSRNSVALRIDQPTQASPVVWVQDDHVGINTDTPEKQLSVKGDTHLDGALSVTGHTDLQADAQVTGRVNIGDDLNVAGNANISGSLNVTGACSLADELLVSGHAEVVGSANFDENVQVQKNLAIGVKEASARIHVQADGSQPALRIDGDTAKTCQLIVTQNKVGIGQLTPQVALDVADDVHIGDSLSVDGRTYLNASLDVKGDTHLDGALSVTGHTDLQADAQVAGRVNIGDDLNVAGTTNISGHLNVADTCSLGDQLSVSGSAEVQGPAHFDDHVQVQKNLAIGVKEASARIHVAADGSQPALRIDGDNTKSCQLIVSQNKVGIGQLTPQSALDVADDVHIGDSLSVDGRTYLNASLDVAQDTYLKSDLLVNEKSRLREQTILGVTTPDMDETRAQLFIADTSYAEAMRIESPNHDSIVVKEGRLGIGTASPDLSLDVRGGAAISETLRVDGNAQLNGELEVEEKLVARGSLDVSKKSEFGSDVQISGDLSVEDRVSIEETLTVSGDTQLDAELTVTAGTTLNGPLTVNNSAVLQQAVQINDQLTVARDLRAGQTLQVADSLAVGTATAQASLHVQSQTEQTPLRVDRKTSGSPAQNLMTLTPAGDLGLGTSAPSARLDVNGNAMINGQLQTVALSNSGPLATARLQISQQLQLGDGPIISGISNDFTLGGDSGVSGLLPTQAAVKGYIDNVILPFGNGGKTHIISTQTEFDRLFNKEGYESVPITENTTVILLPQGNNDYGISPYLLRKTIRLASNVSIVGFNPHSTIIRKQTPKARFELVGSSAQWLSNVHLEGFTFDGNNLHTTQNGGAFYLEYARDCQLNCVIRYHRISGNGAALYGKRIDSQNSSAVNIQALHISHCQATELSSQPDNLLNEGGAAWGLGYSEIHADHCQADQGGAVAWCSDCQVRATACIATANGGGAYRCERLSLYASDCRVQTYGTTLTGKGGGAYYCSDLICDGFWKGNNAAEGPHIYASNSLTDDQEERHYWRGDYVGRRIDSGEGVWRVHNE
ncbi:hypothetical protein [Gynuella sunshinyii]|uniref:Putative acyltransferase n=1 Tax=Gynuella sunshinyii YC6258 TaxID=1445510 RepID=A0A0C5VHV9_9GAMM|nr:hypothetical protein [Gynuella sunshinyii]AJQ94232.1 putative acyltransferase [Gynuella sunshinyii YC6258]